MSSPASSFGNMARAVFAILIVLIMITAGSATIFLMLYLMGFVGK